jgi:hypothetical protein
MPDPRHPRAQTREQWLQRTENARREARFRFARERIDKIAAGDPPPHRRCHAMTPAEVRARVAETRRQQGLPPTISDPTVLAELAAVVADSLADLIREGGDRARSA